ncbi:cytochrome P450 [Amycolatopsis sp. GM8]|uniref:cytochrome P450 n=1 Tax=Amycolatopsis sp. GM8 TaxID=2896530 RepID=UPI001F241F6A|nr:cytochrome P450 [Amycolatopsis sp. GM8]
MPESTRSLSDESFSALDPALKGGRWVEVFNDLRNARPVAHSKAHEDGFYVITRYEDVLYALRHPELYASCPVTIPAFGNPRPMIPIEIDPPMHRVYRAPLNGFFARKRQRELEPEYRAAAARLIDAFVGRGHGDLSSEFCYPLPVSTIMTMFDIPTRDRAHLVELINAQVHQVGAIDNPDEAARSAAAIALQMYEYFAGLIPSRRAGTGNDLLSVLAHADIGGSPLHDDEIVDYSLVAISAGFETTANTLGYSLLYLSEHPDTRRALADDPELVPSFVEELLRWETPTKGLARTVVAEHEIGGTMLRRGDRVLLLYASANRDPGEFDDPEHFDMKRRPNPHLSFGQGPHVCLGMHMARSELKAALGEFLTRIPDFEIDRSALVENTGTTWSLTSLPATWPLPATAAS